jgi:endonuclease G
MKANAAINQSATGDDSHVLPYHHYSVVMNKERGLAYFTAVNIDGRITHRIKRDPDKWIYDPRIERDEQVGNEVYANNPLDRGHLVRRLDPAWGKSEEIAKIANDDTFHFTNCSPQHADFNQNKTTWAGLEDYVLNNADSEDLKVTVFSGPVLNDDDTPYKGVKLPKQFWKVVVMVKENGKLSATAYLLSQESLIENLEEAVFSFGAYKTFQVPVSTIGELTGLSFGSLPNFDPIEGLESVGLREVRSLDQIIL